MGEVSGPMFYSIANYLFRELKECDWPLHQFEDFKKVTKFSDPKRLRQEIDTEYDENWKNEYHNRIMEGRRPPE